MDVIKTAREEAVNAVKNIIDLNEKFEELNNNKSDDFMKWIEEKRVLSILS
jgi:hypothetical protein